MPDGLNGISIRKALVSDIPEILRQRRRMYENMRYTDSDALAEMVKLSADCMAETLAGDSRGSYRHKTQFHAWLACALDKPIAGGAVIISPWLAHPYDLDCRRATILNVYTDPQYRRRGIARRLMRTMIAWCKQQGLARITLHASDDGRHLYESLGFEASNEMRLKLR